MQNGKIKEKMDSISKETNMDIHSDFKGTTSVFYLAGILSASIDEHTKALNRIAAIMERANGFGNMTEKE